MDNFFSHENHPFPPSLSSFGQLRLGKKSDLMGCLEKHAVTVNNARPETDVSIMDGAVLVNMLKPGGCRTFGEYAEKVFVPNVKKEQNYAERVDIVWDQYFDNSLKASTREKRASGPSQRRRVVASSPIPKNWQKFRRLNSNKIELFQFLNNEMLSSASAELPLVVTDDENVLCVPARDVRNLSPCIQEEAESRIFVHVADAF